MAWGPKLNQWHQNTAIAIKAYDGYPKIITMDERMWVFCHRKDQWGLCGVEWDGDMRGGSDNGLINCPS